jgi:hypothetical protein
MSHNGNKTDRIAPTNATDISQDAERMSDRAAATPESQEQPASCEPNTPTPQRREKLYITAPDSESVAEDVRRHGGDYLYAATLTALESSSEDGDDNEDGDDSEEDLGEERIDQENEEASALSVKKSSKDHWSGAERSELYRCVTKYVHSNGLWAFGPTRSSGMKGDVFTSWATRINGGGGKDRPKDAVRSQILKTHKSATRRSSSYSNGRRSSVRRRIRISLVQTGQTPTFLRTRFR